MLADAATHPTAPTKAAAPTPAAAPDRPRWRLAKRVLTGAFFAAVAYLIFQYAREVKWSDVLRALQTTPMATLAGAAALAAASHLVYSTYDVIGREVVGHSLRRAQVMAVGFVSYAFNLNLGSLVGGVALRYRLYSRLGLQAPVITQVLGLSLLTNWLGYLFVAGAVFLLRPLELPPDWKLGSEGLRIVGALALAAGVAYLWMCFWTGRGADKNGQRVWHVRGHELHLPSGRVALVQLGLSALNWSLIAGVVWLLLRGRVDYFSVLSVALVAAVAGVLTHVPAGLGVLEAVFVALLSHRVAQPELLAALLTYRALYYLLPLVLAVPAFMAIDARARGMGTDMGTDMGTRLAKTGATESSSRRDDRLERTNQ